MMEITALQPHAIPKGDTVRSLEYLEVLFHRLLTN
jgi:hypothetical protein